jgi:hypothetical protein
MIEKIIENIALYNYGFDQYKGLFCKFMNRGGFCHHNDHDAKNVYIYFFKVN